MAFECIKIMQYTFSWRWGGWSIWPAGTFCCYQVRQQPETVCVLSETMGPHSIITHLSAASARSVDCLVSYSSIRTFYIISNHYLISHQAAVVITRPDNATLILKGGQHETLQSRNSKVRNGTDKWVLIKRRQLDPVMGLIRRNSN